MSRGKALERLDKVFEKQQAAAIVDAIEAMLEVPAHAEIVKAKAEELRQCEADWKGTLEHFGIEKPVLPYEQKTIWELAKQYDVKTLRYAITGMRWEEGTPSFNPAKNVSLRRLFDPKILEKCVNLAAAKMTAQKKARAEKVRVQREATVNNVQESLRALLPGHMKEGG